MKRIVLCADDYGQVEAISTGILSLIQKKRLSATSCLVNSPHWASHGQKLLAFKGEVDIGLHFNLTEGNALSDAYAKAHGERLMPLSAILSKAFLGKLNKKAIEAELETQIARFVDVMGFKPDFIDGHQHIHQFPIIREALIDIYQSHMRELKPYIRLVNEKIKLGDVFANTKKIIIRMSGQRGLKNLLRMHAIPHNPSFAGIYSFTNANKYPDLFSRFLHDVDDGGLIMCHPGLLGSENDTIAKARFEEYQYMSSAKFLEDCGRYHVKIAQFSSIFSHSRLM